MSASPRGSAVRKPGRSIKEKKAIKNQKKAGGGAAGGGLFGTK